MSIALLGMGLFKVLCGSVIQEFDNCSGVCHLAHHLDWTQIPMAAIEAVYAQAAAPRFKIASASSVTQSGGSGTPLRLAKESRESTVNCVLFLTELCDQGIRG